MIPKCAIHWQVLVQAISRYRFKKEITRGRSSEHGGSLCPATAFPVLKFYYQRMEIQPAAGDGRSSTKLVLSENDTAVPVLNLYYQRTKIQPAAGHGRSSTKLVLPENENPAGRRRRPFQYQTCTTRERKSSQLPATAVPVLNLYYQENGNPASCRPRPFQYTKLVLPENGNPASRWPRPFQYQTCTTRERKSSQPLATAVPVPNLYYQRTEIQPPATAVPVLNLYYQRTKIQPDAGDGRPPQTAVPVVKLYYQRMKNQLAAGDGRSSTKLVLPKHENLAGRRRPIKNATVHAQE